MKRMDERAANRAMEEAALRRMKDDGTLTGPHRRAKKRDSWLKRLGYGPTDWLLVALSAATIGLLAATVLL